MSKSKGESPPPLKKKPKVSASMCARTSAATRYSIMFMGANVTPGDAGCVISTSWTKFLM